MRKIILSMPGCSRCKSLAAQCPDAEVVELDQATLLALARPLNITSMPIVVLSGEPQDLATELKARGVLEEIAHQRKYEPADGYEGCGNTIEVEMAREALGLPDDIK